MSEKRIAVCDDEKIIADHLAEIVRKCIASMDINAPVTVDVFYSAFALDDAVDSGNIYDLIFMDIILKKENGIYLSDNILKKMNHVKIVSATFMIWIPLPGMIPMTIPLQNSYFSVSIRLICSSSLSL